MTSAGAATEGRGSQAVPHLGRLADYARHWAAQTPESPAAVLGTESLSWAGLDEQIDHAAAALIGAGVRRGDRVAVRTAPNPGMLIVYLGSARIGAVFQGLNPKSTAHELSHQLRDAAPTIVLDLLDADIGDVTTSAVTLAELRPLLVGGRDWLSANRAPTASRGQLEAAEAAVRPDDACAIVYTSGTTGQPKGALLPHRGLTHCSVIQANRWYERRPLRVLCNLPASHVGCLGDLCASTIVAGGTVVFQERFDAAGVLRLIDEHAVTHWGAVPAMFALSVATPAWRHARLESLERIFWSGGPMPLSLGRELASRCPRVANAYGMTETVGSVTYTDDNDDVEIVCTTIGRPDPHYEVRVSRPDGEACVVGEIGEIRVRGTCMMVGYLNQPEATAEAIDADGWLHTGDLATVGTDGNLTLVGRTRDVFKSGGYNVYPREIEAVLEEHPGVSLAAVVASAHPVFGEVGHAFVQPLAGPVNAEELRAFAAERLANYKVPKRFTIMEMLPQVSVGKVDKGALRRTSASASS